MRALARPPSLTAPAPPATPPGPASSTATPDQADCAGAAFARQVTGAAVALVVSPLALQAGVQLPISVRLLAPPGADMLQYQNYRCLTLFVF